MKMQSNFRRFTLVTAAALALASGAVEVSAHPPGGPHGQGAGEQMIGQLIERAQAQLNLTTLQQQMLSTAVADTRTLRDAARTRHQQVRDALQAQLAKTEPDLATVAQLADNAEQQNRDARIKVRNQWLALYNTFTLEQKAVVRDLLQKRMARADAFRQHMRERMQQRSSGANG